MKLHLVIDDKALCGADPSDLRAYGISILGFIRDQKGILHCKKCEQALNDALGKVAAVEHMASENIRKIHEEIDREQTRLEEGKDG